MNKYDEYMDFFCSDKERESFELLEGIGRIMISAPHSAEQIREGKIKSAEYETGVMAKCLHDELNCPVIYKTCNCNDDANYDKNCRYKQTLKNYIDDHKIEYLLDLHELNHTRSMDINLGTGLGKNIKNDPSILTLTEGAFADAGFDSIIIDEPFAATFPYTVSAYISRECGIACLQVEINSGLLSKKYEGFRFDDVNNVLKKVIQIINGEN